MLFTRSMLRVPISKKTIKIDTSSNPRYRQWCYIFNFFAPLRKKSYQWNYDMLFRDVKMCVWAGRIDRLSLGLILESVKYGSLLHRADGADTRWGDYSDHIGDGGSGVYPEKGAGLEAAATNGLMTWLIAKVIKEVLFLQILQISDWGGLLTGDSPCCM